MSQVSRLIPSSGPGSGTVTSISAGTGITLTPNPITTTGTVALTVPVAIANGGTNATSFTNVDGVVYFDGTRLVDTTVGTAGQVLTSNGPGLAPTFQPASAAGAVMTLTANSGGAVSPTAGNINVVGDGTTISIAGNPGTSTLTASVVANYIDTVNGNTGTSVTPTLGIIGIVTAHSTAVFNGAGSTLTLDFYGDNSTDANLLLGSIGAITTGFLNYGYGKNSLASISSGNNNCGYGAGSLFTISTANQNCAFGVDALNLVNADDNSAFGYSALAHVSSGINNCVFGSGAGQFVGGSSNSLFGFHAGSAYVGAESNNICISSAGVLGESGAIHIGTNGTHTSCFVSGIDGVNVGSTAKVVTMGTGGTADQLGTATITAGTGITVTPGANTITISTSGSVVSWSVIGANQTAAVNNGYFCNKAGTLALALPATSAVGDIIEVSNINTALGVQFTQAAGQQIFIGNTSTTLGATGTLTSSQVGDALKIVCSAANLTWRVTSMIGNWSVV